MKHNIPTFVKAIFAILVVLSLGVYLFFQLKPAPLSAISASGNVEAVEVKIASEMGGKADQIYFSLGDKVNLGDTLFSLEGTILTAQLKLAKANLDAAEAAVVTAKQAVNLAQIHYDATLDNSNANERSARATFWGESNEPEMDQPVWYFSMDEEYATLMNAKNLAMDELNLAKLDQKSVESKAASGDFLTIETRLAQSRTELVIAKQVRDAVSDATENSALKERADVLVEDAQTALEEAQQDYDDAMITDGANDILEARARVHVAQTKIDAIDAALLKYKTGPRSTQLAVALITLDQAKATLAQAEANAAAAKANVDLAEAHTKKLTIASPIDGVIQYRNLEVGEIVTPGSTLFTILDLTQLSVTVFVSEDRYGEITLGQKVLITADSFPGVQFEGQVAQISDKAEFTPRNVQTSDGRKTTVFAIKIKVLDPDMLLKPGMPADVVFQ